MNYNSEIAMNDNDEIYGAFACILIPFDGTTRQLATKLASALNLGAFEVQFDEYPPHDEIGSAEVLGWEVWLQSEPDDRGLCYRLRIETEHSVQEIFHGRMHDLSPWLARLVSTLCDIKARPAL